MSLPLEAAEERLTHHAQMRLAQQQQRRAMDRKRLQMLGNVGPEAAREAHPHGGAQSVPPGMGVVNQGPVALLDDSLQEPAKRGSNAVVAA